MDFSTGLSIPLIVIAIGGLVLITQRNGWLVVGAIFAQWLGIVWQLWLLPAGGPVAPVEIVTALGCCGIFGLTLWNLQSKKSASGERSGSRQYAIADQLWLWAVAIVAGVAGFGLARLYPLGGSEEELTAFYWIVLPSMLAIVVNGSRDPVKLGAGMISLFNAGLFLVYTLGASSPMIGLLGLAALGRLALAAIIAYSWLVIKATYLDLDLNSLFDLRDSKVGLTQALALVSEPDIELTDHNRDSIDAGESNDTGPDIDQAEAALDNNSEEASGDA
jgi:hypothetical protein